MVIYCIEKGEGGEWVIEDLGRSSLPPPWLQGWSNMTKTINKLASNGFFPPTSRGGGVGLELPTFELGRGYEHICLLSFQIQRPSGFMHALLTASAGI